MKIENKRPPNFDAIVAVFPMAVKPGIVFTYGQTIYAPGGVEISPWICAHEEVHSIRQGADPAAWWAQYLENRQFRFTEETFAHRMEWMTWMNMGRRNRHDKRAMMKAIAGRLSGPLYGKMVDFEGARQLIIAEPPK